MLTDTSAFIGTIIILSINQQLESTSTICDSPKCIQESERISYYIDTNANPCENFYQFACGKFVENSFGNMKLELEQILLDRELEDLRVLYHEEIQKNDHKMVKVAKKLYSGCMNTKELEVDFLTTIKQTLKQVGAWPLLEGSDWNEDSFDWLNATYKLRKMGYEYSAFLDLRERIDGDNKHYLQVEISETRYIDPSNKLHIPKFAELFGAKNKEIVSKELNDVYQFLEKFNEILRMYPNYVNQTIEEFRKGEDTIDWLEFINNLVGSKVQRTVHDYVNFPAHQVLEVFTDLMSTTSKRTVANYMMWTVIQPLLTILPNCPTDDLVCSKMEKRINLCLEEVHGKLTTKVASPIDVIRLRRHLSEEKKKTVENLVDKIGSQFVKTISQPQWIPEEVKQNLVDNVKNAKVVVGISGNYFDDTILDESDVDMGDVEDNASFFTLLAQANRNQRSAAYLPENELRPEDRYGPFMLNRLIPEYYKNNLFYIPVGATKYLLYDENRPKYLNYGTLGTMIGSALSQLLLPLTMEKMKTRQVFTEINECLKIENDTISSPMFSATVTKIISDHVAYTVYQEWVKTNGVEPKLATSNYTPNQLFCIAAANLKCHPASYPNFNGNPYQLELGQSAIYSVSESLRQISNLAKDFNCPVNLNLKCALL